MGKLEELEEEFRELADRFFSVRGPVLEDEEPGKWHIEACRIATVLISKHGKIMKELGRDRTPRVGDEFLHVRLLDEKNEPQRCVIYRIGDRDVFYCTMKPDGSRSSDKTYISKAQFFTILKEWA